MVVTPRAKNDDAMPIRWIGRQHYEGQRALFEQPVLVRADAFGPGQPHRDLMVSGDHCLFIDGHLIPAKLLVNGATIVAQAGHQQIDYFNVELDDHTILLAEGLESESYLDCGNRMRFDNCDEANEWVKTRGYRDSSVWNDGTAFATPLWTGPVLEAIRARLAAKAAEVPGSLFTAPPLAIAS